MYCLHQDWVSLPSDIFLPVWMNVQSVTLSLSLLFYVLNCLSLCLSARLFLSLSNSPGFHMSRNLKILQVLYSLLELYMATHHTTASLPPSTMRRASTWAAGAAGDAARGAGEADEASACRRNGTEKRIRRLSNQLQNCLCWNEYDEFFFSCLSGYM